MIIQGWVQHLEVCVVHILKDKTRRFGLGISYNIKKLDDVGASADVLQDFDLALDLQLEGRWRQHAAEGSKMRHHTFFFFTGLRILIMHFWLLTMFTPSNTSLYLPLPTFLTTS